MLKITKVEEVVAKNTSWLVGKCLSYIDITIEGDSDRYSKKEVLKRLFEDNIYNTRNGLFEKSSKDVIDNCEKDFKVLWTNISDLIETGYAFNDNLKNKMLSLAESWIREVVEKIKSEVKCLT